jgi:biopolymer transport protein TolR
MPMRNHLGAERIVRPDVPRVHATMNATPLSSILAVMAIQVCMTMGLSEQQGLDVALPMAAPGSLDAYTAQVVVEITADRAIALNHAPVTLAELEERLRRVVATRRDKTVYVIGAGSLRYGDIIPAIDAARGAGARVGIVTESMLAISRR